VVWASNAAILRRTLALLIGSIAAVGTGCSISVGARPAATFAPAPAASPVPLPPQELLIDAIAIRLREELARSPGDGWADHVEIVYERAEGSLVYAIARVDDDDLPGAWLALIVQGLDDSWSVIGSRWAKNGGVAASDVNLVPVDAYPYDPALIGFVGPEITGVATTDPVGERDEGAIVERAVDLPLVRDGALVASGEDGLRFAILLSEYAPIPPAGRKADTSPEAGELVAEVARALVAAGLSDTTADIDPAAQPSLFALQHVMERENGPWSAAGAPSSLGRSFAVPLDGGGDRFTLVAAVVAAPDGHLVLHGAQLIR
jgi:hypothetical protein